MEKFCFWCEETKPVSYFTKYNASKDGYYYYCRECLREIRKKRKQEKDARAQRPAEFIQEFQ